MNLIRALIPSWRFFEDFGDVSQLWIRVRSHDDDFDDWFPAFHKPHRKFYNLFLNPEGNLYLAKITLIERLLTDPDNPISVQLVERLAKQTLKEKQVSSKIAQFKISVASRDSVTDGFLSSEFEV